MRLEPLQSAGGFSGARLWRIEAPGGDYCLRATSAEQVEPRRLAGLHRLLSFTVGRGIEQCPAPVRRSDGATFSRRDEWVWQLERWMPGVADFSDHPSSVRLQSALTLLARWHVAARAFVPRMEEAAWFSSIESGVSPGIGERQTRMAEWDAATCDQMHAALQRDGWPEFDEPATRILQGFRRAAPRIERELELGRRVAIGLQPCLRDVWHDHLLFTGDAVTGLIDAHACRSESVAGDLARLLGSLVADDRAAWEIGLAAYEKTRPLSLSERGLVELFDRSAVLLSGLIWLQWRFIEHRQFARPQAVIARLKTHAGRMENLVSRLE